MTQWEKLNVTTPHLQKWIKPGLEFAYLHYAKMGHTQAYVICMCECFLLNNLLNYQQVMFMSCAI